uniref:Integrin-linked protein kinase n=1 Tax=Aceria tosichella TaxID=561515 RepID=A0A6G1SKF1_9ACAR
MDDIFNWCREGETLQIRIWLDDPKNDLNQGDDHGFSPLHWACFAGRTNIVDMLLNRGARINATNMGDDTALHLAASHGHLECVNLLLKNKADVNAMNEHGNTPLHYACFWGHRECAQTLIEHGAQANLANMEGDTPLDKCHKQLVEQLHQVAAASGQDLTKKVSYRDASQMKHQLEQRTRDAKLSRHPEIGLKDLSLSTKAAITCSGETWRGTWNGIEICAKFINYGPECTPRIVRDFTEEFPRLRIFSHPNVLPVIGCVIEPPSLVVVSQYLPLGSLYSLLHERKQFVVDGQQAIKFALDIARGMAFLHSLEPMVSRLYLNSFHVLIDDDLTARISMADAKFSFQERNKVYQPAWMAPEALQKNESEINVRAANMWSFGVLLWELATRQVPFAGMSPIEVGMKVALEDLRLALSGNIQHHLGRMIKICMNEEPGKRPSFDQIVPILTKMAHK